MGLEKVLRPRELIGATDVRWIQSARVPLV
jgi:hypothetical protein